MLTERKDGTRGGVFPRAQIRPSPPVQLKDTLALPGFCGERLTHFPGLSLEGDWALEAER
jgi:hypothetical protein